MQKIAIIGASYLQLPLVEKAKIMGLETHCFAWETNAVCKHIADFFYPISITEKEKILSVCQQLKIDGILTIASDLAVETVNYIAEKMDLIANPYQYTSLVTNKVAMRSELLKNNISSPCYITEKQEDYNLFKIPFPVIVKPTDRSGSLAVEKVENYENLIKAIQKAKEVSFSKEVIIEQYIEGKEVSVESISWQGKHYILAITDKVTTDRYFVEIAHHQPSMLANDVLDKIKAITLTTLNALHIENGAAHTEIKISPKGEVFIIEVGARMGGDFIGSHLVELSTGYDYLKGVIDVALGNFSEPVIQKKHFAGVYFLSEKTKKIEEIIKNADKFPFVIKSEILTNNLKKLQSSADRSGYLIYKSDKRENLL